MGQKADPAQELDARANAAVSLAEGQALREAADRLRRAPRTMLSIWARQPIFRN